MKTITIYKKEDFRKWLAKNHQKESKVSVILYKRHTGKTAPTHREVIEEAICFGWIDTTIKRLDEDRFLRNFSKRTQHSRWSDNTLGYAKRLVQEGKMSDEGVRYYKLGLSKPTHDHGIPKDPSMPPELKISLSKNPEASKRFETFSPSVKRTFYRWILRAKLPATRDKRITIVVESALKNRKPTI